MWRSSISGLLLFLAVQSGWAEERLVELEVASKFFNTDRTIQLYLPPSYHQELTPHYPVLYLHDGQNMFSSAGTNICFGWGSWELDKIVDTLCRARKMQEIILVAVNNSSGRYYEYCGRHHPLNTNTNTEFENYEAFLIQELKPQIDTAYHTRPEPANTGSMGSSMGGICSIVLAWDHPEVFGMAASLSGSFQIEGTNFLDNILRPYRGKPKPTRLYLDSGVVDFTGGDDGQKLTAEVAVEFERIGWGNELMHYIDATPLTLAELEKSGLRRDKWEEAQKSQHNEFYWRLRVKRALMFLFPPN